MNSIERSDMSTIGTWRDDIKINMNAWKNMVSDKGMDYVNDNIISRCPTQCMSVDSNTSELTIDNKNCVKCMHCINVTSPLSHKYNDGDFSGILSPGDDKGVTISVGGKITLKIGDLFGTQIIPFLKVDTEEDYEYLEELAGEMIDFFAENALEHERTGEMIERIGIVNFLEGIGIDVDPNMVDSPRYMSYVRLDKWDEEATKWFDRKKEKVA
jgi:sulfite reductase alpha subunit